MLGMTLLYFTACLFANCCINILASALTLIFLRGVGVIGGKHEPEPSPDDLSSVEKHNNDASDIEKSTVPDSKGAQSSNASDVDEKKSLRSRKK